MEIFPLLKHEHWIVYSGANDDCSGGKDVHNVQCAFTGNVKWKEGPFKSCIKYGVKNTQSVLTYANPLSVHLGQKRLFYNARYKTPEMIKKKAPKQLHCYQIFAEVVGPVVFVRKNRNFFTTSLRRKKDPLVVDGFQKKALRDSVNCL